MSPIVTQVGSYIAIGVGACTILATVRRVLRLLWWLHRRLAILDEIIDERAAQKQKESGNDGK